MTTELNLPDIVTLDGVRYRRLDRMATRVSCWAMYDCHAFGKLKGATVAAVAHAWRNLCESPDEYGAPCLCSVIVLEGDKELRRVGKMVHDLKDKDGLDRWIADCTADLDIPRLLASDPT